MQIRRAILEDCRKIAELALMAGEGIPAYFWEQSAAAGEDLIGVGAQRLTMEGENFCYRNVHVAVVNEEIAGMILAYRLPDAADAESLDDYPEFIRPLIELEQCAPGSFYINMLATFPSYRNLGVGAGLMAIVDRLASREHCTLTSVEVFAQNLGAVRLYQRLGYKVAARRKVVPHECHPYDSDIILLTRPVAGA